MEELYYHVTPTENVGSILQNGLKCDEEGYIYLLTVTDIQERIFGCSVFLPDIIAYEQIGIEEYSLIEVSSDGISSEIEDDKVGEVCSVFQKRIKQGSIPVESIDVIDERTVEVDQIKKYKFCLFKGLSLTEYNNQDKNELWEKGVLPLPFTQELEDEMNSRDF